jgi:hypothetical protein
VALRKNNVVIGPYYRSISFDCVAMGLLIGWVSIVIHPEYRIKNNELAIENTENSELNEEYLKHNVPIAEWEDKYVTHESDKLEKREILTKRVSDLRAIDNYTLQIILALLSVIMIFKGCYTIFRPS